MFSKDTVLAGTMRYRGTASQVRSVSFKDLVIADTLRLSGTPFPEVLALSKVIASLEFLRS